MNKIVEPKDLSEEALLEQLVEESGELVQACAKRLRILRGENFTPVTLEDNTNSLSEECNDVYLCIDILSEKIHVLNMEKYTSKKQRWIERINKPVEEKA